MRFGKKRRKLDLKVTTNDVPFGRLKHHQLGSQDLSFEDQELTQTYNHRKMQPGTQSSVKETGSLKRISSSRIARAAELITRYHIEATGANWNIWRPVWHFILKYEKDTPAIFELFANYFAQKDDFYSHRIPASWRNLDNYKRGMFIELNSIHRKHRFETFYRNVSLSSLFSDFQRLKFENLVVLSLQGLDLTKRNLCLNVLSSMRYLNVSQANVNDQMLKSWSISMKSGNLKNLRCLILNYNNLENLDCILDSPLQYFESDIVVEDPHWKVSTDAKLSVLPDGLKLRQIMGEDYCNSRIIMDCKVSSTECGESLEQLWKSRFQSSNTSGRIFQYIRIADSKPAIPPKRTKPRPKARTKKLDVKTFFDI
ncbi:hypothetical protein KL925_000753 [Ogataea polymorpha]|nr:hypothetical protein KL937_000532 [Ogataea polymorpha]KAG7930011.1 hypothetical protein KL925_000753 [Ogataea polymorpha]KAG7940152.1 hypothetical protein KL904_000015 [Ogataea polymorpha]